MAPTISRRELMRTAARGTVAMSALSYSRILGANDRIQIGQLGCGNRAVGHRQMLKLSSQVDPNFDVRSVCDLWSVNRDKAADAVQRCSARGRRPSSTPKRCSRTRELDAVMIGTGDHQHARLLAEVVRAGKDCYCEKPMANTLEDAKLARDAVTASRQVVQMGSQWLSDPYQQQSPRDDPRAAASARSSRSARAGTSTARAGTCPTTIGSRPFASRTRTGSGGCWDERNGHSIREPISSSGFSRTSRAASPTSGTATGGAGAFLSGHIHPGRHRLRRRDLRLA